ncbi:MAG TPA: hypothetical protein PLE74_07145 [Candidatus Cloacimonadota bacterium]|nr:hypothetical protein [Candidatus Cloacimonadota bacterium]HPT72041.1 hypothetical protein [Candidatus Cloacimonadota bacterium]
MQRYDWTFTGNHWKIKGTNGITYQIKNLNGVYYLKELVTNSDCAIQYPLLIARGYHDTVLNQINHTNNSELIQHSIYSDTMSSEFTKADYKTLYEVGKEILRVKDKIERFTRNHDYGAVDALHDELDQLNDYLKSIATSHKKLKVFYSEPAEIRNCVKQSIRRVYEKIRKFDPAFAVLLMKKIHMYDDRITMERMKEIRFVR